MNGISIVLGSYNRKFFLKKAILSVRSELNILRNRKGSYKTEIIVIDGGSSDGSLSWLLKQKDIITIIQHNKVQVGSEFVNKSWGYFMNLGFKICQYEYICMISDDCLIVPNSLLNAVEILDKNIIENNKIGGIAFYWRNWPEQKLYNVGLTLGKRIFINHGIYIKSALEKVNYLDETTYSFYHADGDVCLKLDTAKYQILIAEDSYVEHYSHSNTKIRKNNYLRQKTDWNSYLSKWQNIINGYEGGWLTKEFKDKNNTYRGFLIFHLTAFVFYKQIIKLLLNKIKVWKNG